MEEHKHQHRNSLLLYRRRMGFSQKYVAHLLGHPNQQMVSRYEHGWSLPPMLTALELEIIYRVPLAFLYGRKYEELRKGIREKEERLSVPTQAVLF